MTKGLEVEPLVFATRLSLAPAVLPSPSATMELQECLGLPVEGQKQKFAKVWFAKVARTCLCNKTIAIFSLSLPAAVLFTPSAPWKLKERLRLPVEGSKKLAIVLLQKGWGGARTV